VSPKRGDRAAPPPVPGEFELRFASSAAADGWEHLARQAPANHRLKGSLATGVWKGQACERWLFEVTGGGRVWYLIDDDRHTAWITYAGTGHPSDTD
jgi:hypothetical protein